MHAFYIPTPDFGLLKEKAETGDAKAQNDLGYHYSFGQDVTQNFVEAFRWFELSAQQGFAEAQNNMARCYHYGRGVEKDLRQACVWYTKAADQNDIDAVRSLFGMFKEFAMRPDQELLDFYNTAMRPNNIPHCGAEMSANA